jgi:AraC-like DNA-binding protein
MRLYESAGIEGRSLKPLWHVGSGRMLFAGCLHKNALHSHSAPVMLAGLYDDFRLRLAGGSWFACRAAVIPAGTAYEFDAEGRPIAVIYIEPSEASAEGLAALVGETREERGVLIGMRADLSQVRSLYEDPSSLAWTDEAMNDLLGFSKSRARRTIDARVRRALEAVADNAGGVVTGGSVPRVDWAAHAAGLSTSRFQHLFKQEAGVSYRRYAAWARMRVAVSEVVKGSNFTTAAHASGFYDQPHFAREFRRIFGAPAGRSLAGVRH